MTKCGLLCHVWCFVSYSRQLRWLTDSQEFTISYMKYAGS